MDTARATRSLSIHRDRTPATGRDTDNAHTVRLNTVVDTTAPRSTANRNTDRSRNTATKADIAKPPRSRNSNQPETPNAYGDWGFRLIALVGSHVAETEFGK